MSQNSYYLGHQGIYGNQQTYHPQDSRHYAPSRSPEPLMHPPSTPPNRPSTQNALSFPYTPSSITSSSVYPASPASTTATSTQPSDTPTYGSPVVDYGLSPVSVHPSVTHQTSALVSGTHIHSAAHVASHTRRRANKQRLDDARRKEICSYARDRPKARQEDIAIKYGVERSTISEILKHKDKWLTLDMNPRNYIPVKHRPSKFPGIETELLKSVRHCLDNGNNITDTRINANAKECAAEIGLPDGKFEASSGWAENFKLRNNLTCRSQDEHNAALTHEVAEDPEHMDGDGGMPVVSQVAQIGGGVFDAEGIEQNSFYPMLTTSTAPESGLAPHDSSLSTFSADSMSNNTQDIIMFHSTPLSSAASSAASSPSGARPQHIPNDLGLRSRAHSHSVVMRSLAPLLLPPSL